MTSKAERARKKRASRKMQGAAVNRWDVDLPAEPAPVQVVFPVPLAAELDRDNYPGRKTDKQSAAWEWFYALRREVTEQGPGAARARVQLTALKSELTDDEYSIMCELCRPVGYVGRRVGRSATTVLTLEMSALRKLVVYRHMNNIGVDQ